MEYPSERALDGIRDVLYQAGGIIRNAHPEQNEIRRKGGEADFVTAWDVRVQEYLISRFAALVPGASFMGEEETGGSGKTLDDGAVFIIDPIDGTTNFMFDRRHSCISVALCVGKEVRCAWVYQPYTEEMWTAVKGGGAFLNARRLRAEDIPLEKGVAAVGAAKHYGCDLDPFFRLLRKLFERCLGLRDGGSAAIDLCRIASGGNICYLEAMLSPWDYAASSLILREAGCVVTQWNGTRITLDSPCSILAAPPTAHSQLRSMIDEDKAAHVRLGSPAAKANTAETRPDPADLIGAGEEEWEDETERTYRDGSMIQECWKDARY